LKGRAYLAGVSAVKLSIERAKALVKEFCATYPVASTLKYKIRETQEELYGPQYTREATRGPILGSFHPRKRQVAFAIANFPSDEEFKRSLRHEILGHFGINTFNPGEKRALLDAIMDARSVPSVTPVWHEVDQNYPAMSEIRKAEEVFAFVCEDIEPGTRIDPNHCVESFLDICIDQIRPLELQDLCNIAALVAEGLHDRTRSQKIFPETDTDQFKQSVPLSVEVAPFLIEPSLEDQLASQESIALPSQAMTAGAVASYWSMPAHDDQDHEPGMS
jgi:putative DNA primase/helicase